MEESSERICCCLRFEMNGKPFRMKNDFFQNVGISFFLSHGPSSDRGSRNRIRFLFFQFCFFFFFVEFCHFSLNGKHLKRGKEEKSGRWNSTKNGGKEQEGKRFEVHESFCVFADGCNVAFQTSVYHSTFNLRSRCPYYSLHIRFIMTLWARTTKNTD